MILQLISFDYVSQMEPRAALHMGILIGLTMKKSLDYGLTKAGRYYASNGS